MDKKKIQEELELLQKNQLDLLKKLNQIEDDQNTTKIETAENLSNDEIMRYSRQLLLPEFGVKAQIKLSKKTKGVLVVGAGGLGCPAIQFMAAAGVSPIGVVDYDTVDLSNLHRQILHTEQKKVSKVHVLKSPTLLF